MLPAALLAAIPPLRFCVPGLSATGFTLYPGLFSGRYGTCPQVSTNPSFAGALFVPPSEPPHKQAIWIRREGERSLTSRQILQIASLMPLDVIFQVIDMSLLTLNQQMRTVEAIPLDGAATVPFSPCIGVHFPHKCIEVYRSLSKCIVRVS